MPSTAPPTAQVIIRCLPHKPKGNAAPYVAWVAPAGDGVALRCRCSEQGFVWMTQAAFDAWRQGTRDFNPRTYTVVIRVGEEAHSVE